MVRRRDTVAGLLSDQGFGSRKECFLLVKNGGVEIGHEAVDGSIAWSKAEDPESEVATNGLHFRVGAISVPWRSHLFIAFHKPSGTECSHTPTHHRSVFSFFPAPFVRRGLEAVGRLDADTTGLLFFSDSGTFNHLLTSPRKHIPKTYRVGTKHPISQDQIDRLTTGVDLRGEDGKTLPAALELLGEKQCHLTVSEGKYHQVKRMFAAVSNRVESIHRVSIGPIRLEAGLAPSEWRFLSETELTTLGFTEP